MMWKKIIPVDDLKRTVNRFPLSTVCAGSLFLLIILNIHDVIDVDNDVKLFGRLMVLSAYGFFWFGLARLIAEGKGWRQDKEYGLGFLVFAVLAALVFMGEGYLLAWLLGLMIPALLLGISIGPYLESRDNLSLWFYNRQTWQGVAISIIAGIIWGAGISAALASIDYLFGVEVESEIYGDIWTFAMIIFAPLYALSWVPDQYKYTEEDCHTPPQLAFVLNWVLAPLLLVYMLILYAYFVKIAIAWEVPRGQLSYMITAFGGIGVLTYLAGWPLREEGGPLLRLLYRVFFPALIVPVGVLALSIYLRIDQYGFTEQRYLVVVATIWMAVLAGAYTAAKPPLKVIPGLLAVMLVFAALGPFSAPNVSARSQFDRLEMLLTKHGILQEGRIVKTEETIPFADRKSISSIVEYLWERDQKEELLVWLDKETELETSKERYSYIQAMGFEYIGRWQGQPDKDSFNFNSNYKYQNLPMDVRHYDFVFPNINAYCGKDKSWSRSWPEKDALPKVEHKIENGRLTFIVADKAPLMFDLHEIIREQVIGKAGTRDRPIEITGENEDIRVRVNIDSLSGKIEEGNPVVSNAGYTLYVDMK